MKKDLHKIYQQINPQGNTPVDTELENDILQAISEVSYSYQDLLQAAKENERAILRMSQSTEIGTQPIVILLVYMVIYYPSKLSRNENIDPDMLKEIFHQLGYSCESYF